jgi:hypothetical protein
MLQDYKIQGIGNAPIQYGNAPIRYGNVPVQNAQAPLNATNDALIYQKSQRIVLRLIEIAISISTTIRAYEFINQFNSDAAAVESSPIIVGFIAHALIFLALALLIAVLYGKLARCNRINVRGLYRIETTIDVLAALSYCAGYFYCQAFGGISVLVVIGALLWITSLVWDIIGWRHLNRVNRSV